MNSTHSSDPQANPLRQRGMNRFVYGIFTCAGLIFAGMKDWNNAMIFLGLAPIFDPFAPLPFKERQAWQKTWLFLHVTLTMIVLAILMRGILT